MIKLALSPEAENHLSKEQSALIDATFWIPSNSQLKLNTRNWDKKASEYLEHAVSRNPRDLRSQVQRVYLYLESRDKDALYGALVDMFIALKQAGRELRYRLLQASKAVLDERYYQYLAKHLDAGLTETDVTLPCRTSLLSKGLSGTNRLVIPLNHHAPKYRDPLQEAQDHIEYGQIDQAREVLEAAILQEPQRTELQQDLLEIYRSTQAKQAFHSMRKRLEANKIPVTDAWRELADRFTAEP